MTTGGAGAPADQLCDLLVAHMTGNDPLHDDVRMLAVRWTPLDHLAAAAGPHGRSGRSFPIRRETEVRPTATCG